MRVGTQHLLAVGFATAVLAVAWQALVIHRHFREEQQNIVWAVRSEDVLAQIHAILFLTADAQSAVRGFALSGRETGLAAHADASVRIMAGIERLREMTADEPFQQQRLPELEQRARALVGWQRTIIQTARERGPMAAAELVNSGRGDAFMQALRETSDEIEAEEQRLKPARWRSAEQAVARAQQIARIVFALIFILLVACYLLVRDVLRRREKDEATLRQFTATLDERVRERTTRLEAADAELRRTSEEQRRVESAHREAELRFRALVEQASDMMLIHDGDGQLTDVNECACSTLGYTRSELLGMNVGRIAEDSEFPGVRAAWTNIQPGRPMIFASRFRRRDGATFPVEIRIGCTDFQDRRMFIELARDISDRQEAERTQALFEAIVESSGDAIISVTPEWIVVSWNSAAERLLGYSAAEIIGHSSSKLFPPSRQTEFREITEGMKAGRVTGPFETVRCHKDGHLVAVMVTASPLMDSAGRVIGGTGILRDVADRKRLEAEVLRVSEYEQQRLGHDLHDGVGQQLTAIELMLHQLAGDYAGDDRARQQPFENLSRHLRETIRDVRGLARGLAPFILDSSGLQTALYGLVQTAVGPARCELVCVEPIPPINHEAAMQLYRIAQEAFNNALKHSGATKIEIHLGRVEGELRLEVTDNGCGCQEPSGKISGLGLQIMNYRANLIGAGFAFNSAPGRGVTVSCALPLYP